MVKTGPLAGRFDRLKRGLQIFLESEGVGGMTGRDWKRVYQMDLRATELDTVSFFKRFKDRRFKFYKSLRRAEYYTNCRHDPLGRIIGKFLRFRHGLLCDKYNWTIPINVFGEGLAIVHTGTIVVSGSARVGKNCRIHVCVNIGRAPSKEGTGAPVLGDNVYIGPGAKLFGAIRIGSNTSIGANAVVNRSFPDGNCSIAGVPARKISDHPGHSIISEP